MLLSLSDHVAGEDEGLADGRHATIQDDMGDVRHLSLAIGVRDMVRMGDGDGSRVATR